MRVRFLAPAATFVLVAAIGCGSLGAGSVESPAPSAATAPRTEPPSPAPCTMSSPTVGRPLVTGGTLPVGPSAAPPAALAVTFGLSTVDRQDYFVDLVDLVGHVVASARARLRSPVTGTCGNDFQVYPAMPLISTSAGRVYYLDGDTDVRFLAPDGSTGLAIRVSGSSQSIAMFAVSPDDRMIAVSSFDYRSHPVAASLYVEDLGGSGNHVDLPSSGLAYRWPAGWHGGDLLVGSDGTADPGFGFYAPLPYRITEFQLLDPTTGGVVATLGDSGCLPQSSLPSPGGVACETSVGAVGAIDWSGKTTIFATSDVFTGGASLAPDGKRLAASGSGAVLHIISHPATGGTESNAGGGYPGDGGWLDANHVVVRGAGSPGQSVIDLQSGGNFGLPSQTVLAARLPGGY